MNCILIEYYNSTLTLNNDDLIIALTPLASYQLDKAGITYRNLEEYYDEKEFMDKEKYYYSDQLKWFEYYDNFLFTCFPYAKENNIHLASSNYFYNKTMVDSIIQRCQALDKFIKIVKPDKIIYVSNRYPKVNINLLEFPLLFQNGPSLFYQTTPLFCKKYGSEFQRIFLENNKPSDNSSIINKYLIKLINYLKSNRFVIFLFYNYKTFNFPKLKNNKNINVLFLKRFGYEILDLIKESKKYGYQIYFKDGDNIFKNDFINYKLVKNILPNKKYVPLINKSSIIKELRDNSDVIKWINNYCGIDVSSIIIPKIKYFIYEYCPNFISLINEYLSFYQQENINYVFTPHTVNASEFAAIYSSRISKMTKSVCLQHGNDVLINKYMDHSEYSPYELYLTTDNEMENHINNRIELNKLNLKIFQYPYRLERLFNCNKNRKYKKEKSKTLVYVPTMYEWDVKMWSELRFVDTWYFKWSKELLKYFAKRTDYNIIWKGIPTSNIIYDPIYDLIKDNNYKNIKYNGELFTKWLSKSDLVLLDFPSTALYEAAWSGVPVLSLYYSPYFGIRESAKELFGKSLQSYESFEEGIAKIESFMNSNTEKFKIQIPYKKEYIWEKLKNNLKS